MTQTQTEALVRKTVEDHVARVCLHSPPGNRFSLAMMHALLGVTRSLVDDDIRVVLLCAEGDDFSQGADLGDVSLGELVGGAEEERVELARLGARIITAWSNLGVPTVAAARGRVIGAGAGLLSVCDFRFLSREAVMGFPEVDRGMHLSWGILPHLVRVYRMPTAKRLSLGGGVMGASELPADAVTVVGDGDLDSAALAYAQLLAAKPPLAVGAILSVLRGLGRGDRLDPDTDARLFAETTDSADFREALHAWAEKRPGRYEGR